MDTIDPPQRPATALSVNVNKVCLMRNAREGDIPDPLRAAELCIQAGCHGVTVHPRPDQRHVRPDDVFRLKAMLDRDHPEIEFNLEGNPFAGPEPDGYPGFMALARQARPHQVTLVPDSPDQLTSDHGWRMTEEERQKLRPLVDELRALGSRVSLFVDAEIEQEALEAIARLGVERVELYTGPYAEAFGRAEERSALERFAAAGRRARAAGLELNAGHDLNRQNVGRFLHNVEQVREVSIGHALIADALEMGYAQTIRAFLNAMAQAR